MSERHPHFTEFLGRVIESRAARRAYIEAEVTNAGLDKRQKRRERRRLHAWLNARHGDVSR